MLLTIFKLYQMDVKNAFLNGPIKEEVYVEQPMASRTIGISTMLISSPRCATGLNKHQEHGRMPERFFISNDFKAGKADPTLFQRHVMVICLYAKSLLTKSLVRSLAG
jgi:hypothetical protein